MANIGELVAAIRADTSQLERALRDSRQSITGFSSHAGRSFQGVEHSVMSLKRAVVGLAGAAGIGMIAKSFISAASEAENYKIRLEVLLRSQSEGNRLFKEMADYAGDVTHTYQDIMASATNLAGVMKGGVDEITRWMPMIGDLAAVTGFTVQETTGQIIRMYSAGAAAADMFREKGILSMLGFQAKVSYSAEETRRMIIESWSKADSQWRGAADRLGKTWRGLMSMIQDRWFQLRNVLMDAGIFDELKKQAQATLDTIDSILASNELREWAKDMAEVMKGVAEEVRYVREEFGKLILIIGKLNDLDKALTGSNLSERLSFLKEIAEKVIGYQKYYISSLSDLVMKILGIEYEGGGKGTGGKTPGARVDMDIGPPSIFYTGTGPLRPAINIDYSDLEAFQKRWENASEDMADIFTDSLITGFDDFAEQARRIFARAFIDQTLTPAINKMMSNIFGPEGFLQSTELPGGASLGNVLGAGALGYGMGGMYGGLGAGGGYMLGTAMEIGGPVGMIAGGLVGTFINELTKKMPRSQFEIALENSISSSIGKGFADAIQSGGFQTFKDSFNISIRDMIAQSFKQAFTTQFLNQFMSTLQPIFEKINIYGIQQAPATGGFANAIIQGMPQITMGEITADLQEALGGLPGLFEEVRPVFETFYDLLATINETLGINTEAITENTSAILGPVDAYLNQLAGMDNGPTSLAWLENQRMDLWTKAMADPEWFSKYSSFMTSGYIDMQKGTGGFDFSGERQAVEGIPWVQEARGLTIVNNIVVNDEVVQQQVLDALDNPNVVKKYNSRVSKYF